VPPSNTAASVSDVPVCVRASALAAVAFRPPLAFESPAVGVGQISRVAFTAAEVSMSVPSLCAWFGPPFEPSCAVGVGHVFAAPVSVRLPRANVPLARPLSAAHGVGQSATASSRFRFPLSKRRPAVAGLGVPRLGSPSLACGVGHVANAVSEGPPARFGASCVAFES
jgi:hypothetical protein